MTATAHQAQRPDARTGPARPGPLTGADIKPIKMRRRPALVGLGIALLALGALTNVWFVQNLGDTLTVTAVANDIARGQVIQAGDLTTAELPTGPSALQALPAQDMQDAVGQRATVDLLAGSLLHPDAYLPELTPPAGQSVVGISLTAYQMPTEPLRAGDTIRIVETPTAQGEPPATVPLTITATILSTTPSPTGDQTIVNVQVAHADAADLAARAATGRVALILDSVEG
jgi:SAF domain